MKFNLEEIEKVFFGKTNTKHRLLFSKLLDSPHASQFQLSYAMTERVKSGRTRGGDMKKRMEARFEFEIQRGEESYSENIMLGHQKMIHHMI